MKLNNNDDSHNSGLNLLIYNMLLDIESHPAWVCGLKPQDVMLESVLQVTPCVGVWIETWGGNGIRWNRKSHTLRGCVDWNPIKSVHDSSSLSHPAWVCGLKRIRTDLCLECGVTPCVGVWIETQIHSSSCKVIRSHTLRGCVDWNVCWDTQTDSPNPSHPAWVCGLKLKSKFGDEVVSKVTPCVGVWIETENN